MIEKTNRLKYAANCWEKRICDTLLECVRYTRRHGRGKKLIEDLHH
jgi:hypothetical protein